jgi:hypothetical protein
MTQLFSVCKRAVRPAASLAITLGAGFALLSSGLMVQPVKAGGSTSSCERVTNRCYHQLQALTVAAASARNVDAQNRLLLLLEQRQTECAIEIGVACDLN